MVRANLHTIADRVSIRTRISLDAIGVQPFESFLASVAVFNGLAFTIGFAPPSSIAHLLPKPMVLAWGAMLLVGGLFVLIGLLFSRPRRELAGLLLLGYSALAYAVAVTAFGPTAFLAGAIVAAFGAACLRQAQLLKLGR